MATRDELAGEWKIASNKKMVSYGFGYVIINFFLGWGLVSLHYFYQDEIMGPAGIDPLMIYIGLFIAELIFTLWNMVNDPLLGFLTDRPFKWTKKWGLRAPWVVLCAGPMIIFYILLWMPPSENLLLIMLYFILITCLFDGFFSIYNDHVYGGFTNQFPSEFERRRGFAIGSVIMGVCIIFLNILQVNIQDPGHNNPGSFVTAAIIISIFLIVFNIILFLGIGESEEMKAMFIRGFEAAGKIGFFQMLKVALKRRNFVISLTGYTVSTTAMLFYNGMAIWMYLHVYQMDYAMATLPTLIGVAFFLGFIPVWVGFARKRGFKKTYYTCFFLHGLSFLPFLFIPAGSLLLVIIFHSIHSIFYSGEVLVLMPVASDTCDEVAVHLGRRQDGTLQGIRTFFFRISLLIWAIALPLMFIITAYEPGAAEQNPFAILGIRVLTGLLPAVLYCLMAVIFKKWYTLDGEEKANLVRTLKEKDLVRM